MSLRDEDALLGHIALHYELITREHLYYAKSLQDQEADGRDVGEVLLSLGLINGPQLEWLRSVRAEHLARTRSASRGGGSGEPSGSAGALEPAGARSGRAAGGEAPPPDGRAQAGRGAGTAVAERPAGGFGERGTAAQRVAPGGAGAGFGERGTAAQRPLGGGAQAQARGGGAPQTAERGDRAAGKEHGPASNGMAQKAPPAPQQGQGQLGRSSSAPGQFGDRTASQRGLMVNPRAGGGPGAPPPAPEPPTPVPQVAPALTPTPHGGASPLLAILAYAAANGASDVHVHTGAPLKIRLGGRLIDIGSNALSPEEAKMLVFSALTEPQRKLLLERGELDLAYSPPGLGRYRVNVYHSFRGYDGVFRLVPPQPPTLEQLRLPASLKKLTDYHQGLVLITGPSGCGKSTTMAALIDIINQDRAEHILSIEDPIECLHPSKAATVNQRQVTRHTESFARALRGALREDPDVIAIGELRDLETIQLALSAAETGHLVFGTLHTNGAVRTIDRIVGVYPPSQQAQIRTMISESLRAIVSQRLLTTVDGRSRVPALEILIVNKAVSNLIRENRTFQIKDVLQIGQSQGMALLDNAIADLLKNGLVTKEEALRHVEDPKRLQGG